MTPSSRTASPPWPPAPARRASTTSSGGSATPGPSPAFLASAFGFDLVAYAGPETGRRDRVQLPAAAGRVRFMVVGRAAPRQPDRRPRAPPTATASATSASSSTTSPRPTRPPLARRRGLRTRAGHATTTRTGAVHHAAIRAYGDTVHTFLDRVGYTGPSPRSSSRPTSSGPSGPTVGITRLDHVVANVERGHLDEWVGYYERVLGFDQLIHFERRPDLHRVLGPDVDGGVERRQGRPAHQRAGRGPPQEPDRGVPRLLRRAGRAAHRPAHRRHRRDRAGPARPGRPLHGRARPSTTTTPGRGSAGVDLPWEALAELGILVDRDHEGYLLQIFTETLTDRPTVFFEIIQREGAKGFGEGNFKALFESIERAQARRGNLLARWTACRSGCGASRAARPTSGLPPGTVEEEHGRSGFYGPASHLYRLHPPTDWRRRRRARPPTTPTTPAGWTARDDLWPTLLLGNHQVSIALHRYRHGPARVPARRRRRRAVLRPRRAAGGCAPSTGRSTTGPATTSSSRVAPPTGSSRPTPTDLLVVEAYELAFRAARPGPARPPRPLRPRHASRCPRPRRSTRRASSPSS